LSYDVRVYGAVRLSADEFTQLLQAAFLATDSALDGQHVTVLRGARRRYSFSVDGPMSVAPEDVPDDIVALTLEASVLYTLSVEGTLISEIPHALRFAKRLAAATRGVMEDPQTGSLWSAEKLRVAPRVERSAAIDVLQLTWYTPAEERNRIPASWIECARRSLPEALPRRFGYYEPLQGSLAKDGLDAFLALAADSHQTTLFRGTSLCVDGIIGGLSGGGPITVHRMTLLRDPLDDPRWREAVVRFFADFADSTSAVFASAELVTGIEWSGRTLWIGFHTEQTAYLAPQGKWMGLPPYPISWAWFGSEYIDELGDALDVDQLQRRANGAILEFERIPKARTALPSSRIPEDYRAQYAEPPQQGHSIRLSPAKRMPDRLRPDKIERANWHRSSD
jgi:hypothetical protein